MMPGCLNKSSVMCKINLSQSPGNSTELTVQSTEVSSVRQLQFKYVHSDWRFGPVAALVVALQVSRK